jgi:hypothetical protein
MSSKHTVAKKGSSLDTVENDPRYKELVAIAKKGLAKLAEASIHADFEWLQKTAVLCMGPPHSDEKLSSNSALCEVSRSFKKSYETFFGPAKGTGVKDGFIVGSPDSTLLPITDITVLFKGEKVPEGYKVLDKTKSGKVADLNYKNGGKSVFLAYSRAQNNACITGLAVIYADKGEQPPPEFEVIKKTSQGALADLNAGNGGHQVFLCVRRSFGAPIIDIEVVFPLHGESLQPGFVRLTKTVFGFPADLNTGSNGEQALLSYKPDLDYLVRLVIFGLRTPSYDVAFTSPVAVSPKEISSGELLKNMPTSTRNLTLSPTVPQRFDFAPRIPEGDSAPTGGEAVRRGSSMELDFDKFAVGDDEMLPNSEVSFAYMRWIFPFMAAIYSRNKELMALALSWVKEMTVARVIFTPTDLISEEETITPFDVFISCLYHTSMMTINDTYSDIAAVVCSSTASRKGQHDLAMSYKSVHRMYRTLWSMFFFFQSRFNLLEEKRRRALSINRIREAEGYGKALLAVREQLECCHKGLLSMVEDIIQYAEVHTGKGAVEKSDEGTSLAVRAARSAIDLCLERVDLMQFAHDTNNVFISHHSNSSSFAQDVYSVGCLYFETSEDRAAYLMLLNVLKRMAEPLKSAQKKDYNDRVAALEVLYHLLNATGNEFRKSSRWNYLVRRMVVPILIVNVNGTAVNIVPIFRRLLQLMTLLWKHYKHILKTEIAVLVEQFLIKILRSKNATVEQQIDIIQELAGWCDVPQGLIEMFLNYDNDQSGQPNLVFLIVSSMIETCDSQATNDDPSKEKFSKELQVAAQSCLSVILRAIMNASATVHLISHDDRTKKLSEAGWMEDDYSPHLPEITEDPIEEEKAADVAGEYKLNPGAPKVKQNRSLSLLSLTKGENRKIRKLLLNIQQTTRRVVTVSTNHCILIIYFYFCSYVRSRDSTSRHSVILPEEQCEAIDGKYHVFTQNSAQLKCATTPRI